MSFRWKILLVMLAVFVTSNSVFADRGYLSFKSHSLSFGGGEEVDCKRTLGYWGSSTAGKARLIELVGTGGMILGNRNYTAPELNVILDTPSAGNALIILAHNLIAAKLNILNGTNDKQLADDISNGNALIGKLVIPPVGKDSVAPDSVLGQQMLALEDDLDDCTMGI